MAFYQYTTLSEQTVFFKVIQQVFIQDLYKPKEIRGLKKQLYNKLKKQYFELSNGLVEKLIYLNLQNNHQEVICLLLHEKREDIFELAYMFVEWENLTNHIMLVTNSTVNSLNKSEQYVDNSVTYSKKMTVDITKEILNVLEILKKELDKKQIQVCLFLVELPLITGKEKDFFQIWYNLISNAIYAMSPKGMLTIKTINKNNNITIELSDTGQGVSNVLKDQIFDPFFSTNYPEQNVRFGLFFIKNTLDSYQTTIELKSLDNPITFKIVIPVH